MSIQDNIPDDGYILAVVVGVGGLIACVAILVWAVLWGLCEERRIKEARAAKAEESQPQPLLRVVKK